MDHDLVNESSDSSFKIKLNEDKLPHDASVFVGSLPSNIDQGNLTRMLMEHLSDHTQIQSIKVIRDSKGGVCAFIQCKDADSATALIQNLYSNPPKPFLGRILRYEPARAFRTLLVSYRAPTQTVSPGNLSPEEIKLDLPDAMRIWKHRNSRFHSILYNAQAIDAQESRDRCNADGVVLDNAVFLHPMKYDEETLHNLATYFGRLEVFRVFKTEKDCNDEQETPIHYSLYPIPHNSPRTPTMDPRCWEIKWEHRDDCVSALMTLRRVPHITATWAHQPSSHHPALYPGVHHITGTPPYSLHAQHRGTAFHPFLPSAKFHRPQLRPAPLTPGVDDIHSGEEIKEFTTGTPGQRPWNRKAISLSFSTGHQNTFEEFQDGSAQDGSVGPDDAPDADSQDIYMPQTPALDALSATPVTPGSQFPITPSTSGGCEPAIQDRSLHHNGFDNRDNGSIFNSRRNEKEIDPTTLFVGGLEMFGPGAWDDEKVTKFFSRFGGLESVKVVRPLNACAAFAFVKFDNPESPARAVYEEHNRVYEGRAMRVQLRDCNPPRNNWKYGRGRGRYQNHFSAQRRFDYQSTHEEQAKNAIPMHNSASRPSIDEPVEDSGIQLSSLVHALPHIDDPPHIESCSNLRLAGPASSGTSVDDCPKTESYREWYDQLESPTCTPPPPSSSLGSSASITGAAYSAPPYQYMPHASYLSPPHWVHPYMHQSPYQIPYYPGYPPHPPSILQQPPQFYGSTSASNASGPATNSGLPAMGVYGSFIPYPVMSPRTQGLEQGHPSLGPSQAPLLPTGFIQNEQGTLIAVYQPEALDQYMAGSGGTPASVVNAQGGNTQRWIPYSSHHSEFIHPANQGPPRGALSTGAAPSQRFPDVQRPPIPFRRGDDIMNSPSHPLYRRQGGRRETVHNYNYVRNSQNANQPRAHNGKPFRGHMQNMRAQDYGHPAGRPGRPHNGDWNR